MTQPIHHACGMVHLQSSPRNRSLIATTFAALLVLYAVPRSKADNVSISSNGINSQGIALMGQGVALGQVDPFRPGKLSVGDSPSNISSVVLPTAVFTVTGPPVIDFTLPRKAPALQGR